MFHRQASQKPQEDLFYPNCQVLISRLFRMCGRQVCWLVTSFNRPSKSNVHWVHCLIVRYPSLHPRTCSSRPMSPQSRKIMTFPDLSGCLSQPCLQLEKSQVQVVLFKDSKSFHPICRSLQHSHRQTRPRLHVEKAVWSSIALDARFNQLLWIFVRSGTMWWVVKWPWDIWMLRWPRGFYCQPCYVVPPGIKR